MDQESWLVPLFWCSAPHLGDFFILISWCQSAEFVAHCLSWHISTVCDAVNRCESVNHPTSWRVGCCKDQRSAFSQRLTMTKCSWTPQEVLPSCGVSLYNHPVTQLLLSAQYSAIKIHCTLFYTHFSYLCTKWINYSKSILNRLLFVTGYCNDVVMILLNSHGVEYQYADGRRSCSAPLTRWCPV